MKKVNTKRIILLVLAATLVVGLAVLPSVAKKTGNSRGKIVSAVAAPGVIDNCVYSGGMLEVDSFKEVTVPDGVEITKYLVSEGEYCEEGTPLAAIDKESLLPAVNGVMDSMAAVEEELKNLPSSETKIFTAPADGRVKAIYAQQDDNAWHTSVEHGSLLVMSLDGLMSVSFEAQIDVKPGEQVTVMFDDESECAGKIKSVASGKAIAVISDDGPEIDSHVRIRNAEGETVGEGNLQVNLPWTLVASDGTVSRINVREGQKVWKGAQLITLKNCENMERARLSEKHREYEEMFNKLMEMMRTGQICAPASGYVANINQLMVKKLASEGTYRIQLLSEEVQASFRYVVVMVTGEEENGMYPVKSAEWPFPVTDESQLTLLATLAPSMLEGQEETQASILPAEEMDGVAVESVAAGDLFVLVYCNDEPQKTVRVGHTDISPALPPEESQESELVLDEEFDTDIPAMDFSQYADVNVESDENMFPTEENAVMTVSPADKLILKMPVDERDVLYFQLGMATDVSVDSLSGRVFKGAVREVSAIGTSNGGSSKYQVTIEVERCDDMLPGMTAYAKIVTGTIESEVCVPAAAVTDEGSKSFVYLGYDEKSNTFTEKTEVVVGASDGENVEIISGLESGQQVWYKHFAGSD